MTFKPLKDNLVVRLDESIPSAAKFGLILPSKTDGWRAKDGAVEGENRGTVVDVGPGLRNAETGEPMGMSVKPGDIVRFSELEFPSETVDGRKHVLISEMDILWAEDPEDPEDADGVSDASLIQPAMIRAEIESLMGFEVAFSWQCTYDVSKDRDVLRFSFEAEGRVAEAVVERRGRALSMNDFTRRILEPMVQAWQQRVIPVPWSGASLLVAEVAGA